METTQLSPLTHRANFNSDTSVNQPEYNYLKVAILVLDY